MLVADINPNDIVVALPATMVSMLVGVVIPIVVGLATKASWSGSVKAVLLALLAGVSALVTTATVADGSAVISWGALFTFFGTFAVAVATHFGFWKPTGSTAKAQASGLKD